MGDFSDFCFVKYLDGNYGLNIGNTNCPTDKRHATEIPAGMRGIGLYTIYFYHYTLLLMFVSSASLIIVIHMGIIAVSTKSKHFVRKRLFGAMHTQRTPFCTSPSTYMPIFKHVEKIHQLLNFSIWPEFELVQMCGIHYYPHPINISRKKLNRYQQHSFKS